MGDRTNIADTIERAMRNEGLIDKDVRLMGEIITEALDAAGYDVVLRADPDTSEERSCPECGSTNPQKCGTGNSEHRHAGDYPARPCCQNPFHADPDTSDEHMPCPHCNDEGVVCTLDGDIIGPCDCTSDDLFTEARRLLDAATPGPWERPSSTANWFTVPQPIQIDEADWGQEAQENGAMCGYRIGTLADERAWRYADAELIAAAPRLIAALLERAATAEADRDEWRHRYEHWRQGRSDVIAARERAEAEARQLREAIKTIAWTIDPEDGMTDPALIVVHMEAGALEDLRAAIAAAVAEGAEDRGQTDG